MIKLYENRASGNCYKVHLTLTQLGIPHERVAVDLVPVEERPAALLQKTLVGKVPVVELEDGTAISESNAILVHFAAGTPLLPDDELERTRVMQWLFFEQNQHEPNVATKRYWMHLSGQPEERAAQYPLWHAQGTRALEVMERHLATHDWFVGGRYTIADVALYAYTHVAHEGGFDLQPFEAIRRWMERVAAQPGHVLMDG